MAPHGAHVASLLTSTVSKAGSVSKNPRFFLFSPKWIKNFNTTLSASPQTSLGTFLLTRNVSWYTFAALYSYSGMFSFLPELAVGYLFTKCTTKFRYYLFRIPKSVLISSFITNSLYLQLNRIRQPVNVGLAAILAKAFPTLTEINSKSLVGILSPSDIGIRSENVHSKSVIAPTSSSSPLFSNYYAEKSMLKLIRSVEDAINGPVNRYGFALYLASRITLFSSIVSVGFLTHIGYDLSALLLTYGVSETIQATGSGFAAATLSNVVLLPMQLYYLPDMINVVNNKCGKYASADSQELYLYVLWRATLWYRYLRRHTYVLSMRYHRS